MQQKDNAKDRQLMQGAVIDPACLAELVERYSGPLLAFVFRYVGNRETAEDIVQETFLRALRHRHKLAGIRYVSTWFHTIAANMAKRRIAAAQVLASGGVGRGEGAYRVA